MVISIYINDNSIIAALETVLQRGAEPWYRIDDITECTDLFSDPFSTPITTMIAQGVVLYGVELVVHENREHSEKVIGHLTRETLRNGLTLWYKKHGHFDGDRLSADAADEFLQLSVLGMIKY